MAGDQPGGETPRRSTTKRNLIVLIVAIVVLNVVAIIVAPPFPRDGQPGTPAPTRLLHQRHTRAAGAAHRLGAEGAAPAGSGLIVFAPSLSSTLVTLFIVSVGILIVGGLAARLKAPVPGFIQNFTEWSLRVAEPTSGRAWRARRPSRTCPSSSAPSCSSSSATGRACCRSSGGSSSCAHRRATST